VSLKLEGILLRLVSDVASGFSEGSENTQVIFLESSNSRLQNKNKIKKT